MIGEADGERQGLAHPLAEGAIVPFIYAKPRQDRKGNLDAEIPRYRSYRQLRQGRPTSDGLVANRQYAFVERIWRPSVGHVFVDEEGRAVPGRNLKLQKPSDLFGRDMVEEPASEGLAAAWSVSIPALLRDVPSYRKRSREVGSIDYHERLELDPTPISGSGVLWYRIPGAGLDGADAQDGASLCRRRFLVVIGDGADTPLYGGEACNIGADNAPVVDAADCSGGRGTCMRLPALDANLAVKGCPCDAALNEVCLPVDPAAPAGAQACMVPACSYPEGYPYEKADTYAAHLYGLGVTVYTIAFNATPEGLARMKRIAAAGSPGEGPGGRDGWFEARSEAELREALDRIANAAFAESTPAGSPVAAVPGVGDVFDGELANRDVRQVRLFAYTDSGVGLDSVRYGRIQQQVLGCEGDPAPGERAIKVLGERRLDEIYADQAKVRTVSRNPINRAAFAVTGAGAAMFQEDGAALAADLNEAISLTGVADNLLLRTIGHLFHGHFGDAGLPGGQPGPRQIGAILNGDRTLVETPAIGLNLPSYEQFFQDQRLRPTLLASGAQDGKVHVFRVDTGQEVVSFLPRLAWNEARTGGFPSDGPLSSGDVVACRGLGIGAGGDCPGELTNASFRTLLVGGVGRGGGSSGGRNLFGVDLTNVNNMAAQMDADLDAAGSFSRDGQPMLWNVTGPGTSSTTQVAQLGNAVSRPVLGHVRIGDEIRAVAIAGCGDDPDPEQAARANPAGVGRCVLIIDAVTGALLADPITSNEMVYPMVGSPAVYPAATTAPIERIYIGDRQGQLFRIDLRDTLSANWRADKAWPPEEIAGVNGVNPAEYSLGRAVLGAPAVASAEDGNLVVVFGQGESGDGARANAVSFTDRAVLENGQVRFQVEGNWVLPLREGESIVSEPIVLDSVVYTTTTEQVVGDELCLPSLSRLYAMHFTDITVNDEGEKQTYTREDNTAIYVKPMLPRVQEDGTADTPGLSLVLAPGLKAYGMTIVRTPSCRQEEGPTTDLILSAGSDSSRANAGQAQGGANRQRIEYRSDNNQLASVAYDRSVFVESSGVGLRVCLNCDRDGNAAQGFAGRLSPFPSQVLFWGTSFSD